MRFSHENFKKYFYKNYTILIKISIKLFYRNKLFIYFIKLFKIYFKEKM